VVASRSSGEGVSIVTAWPTRLQLKAPGASRHTRPSPEGDEPPSMGRPFGLYSWAAVLEPGVVTVAATEAVMLAATVMVMVMLGVTVLVMVAVTAVAMVTVLLPARATATAGQATWSAPVAGQLSRHLVANIGPAPRQDASPPRRLGRLVRAAE